MVHPRLLNQRKKREEELKRRVAESATKEDVHVYVSTSVEDDFSELEGEEE